MSKKDIRFQYIRYSENTILVKGLTTIDDFLHKELLFYKNKIENHYNKVIVEVILSFNWLLVIYVSAIENFYSEVLQLKSLARKGGKLDDHENRLWKIPVCYSSKLTPELTYFAEMKSLSVEEIIKAHTTPLYTVFFIGFLPGFVYLGGLNKELVTPRKSTPSPKIEKGTVAIGGSQTGVYPCDSPGGWYGIGKTPVNFFDVTVSKPCFVSPGDKIQFISIDECVYNDISILINSKVYQPESSIL